MSTTDRLHWLEDNTKKAACCRVLTREFDMSQGGHKSQYLLYECVLQEYRNTLVNRIETWGNQSPFS